MIRTLNKTLRSFMIQDVPEYANKFFYSLGFLSATSLVILIVTGTVMALFGPGWWLTTDIGRYMRGVHMWATQAFVLFIILHLLIVFFTSAFRKPRRLTWVVGVLMLLFVLAETEFGFVLRGDFSSQWRSLQGADFYNGGGLGHWLNALNYQQIYGIHIAVIPLLILGLLFFHYLLIWILGIAKPYHKDIPVKTVPANHKRLFAHGGILAVAIFILAFVLPSPFLKPTTVEGVAKADPKIVATTLVKEFDKSSDTAGYVDNIAPYTFDTRQVFVYVPYAQLIQASPSGTKDQVETFLGESSDVQSQQLKDAAAFYDKWDGKNPVSTKNTVIKVVDELVGMAKAGLYEPALSSANNRDTTGNSGTYVLRFLSDSGVLEEKATSLNMTTQQYGMLREESGNIPGAWWLAPIGLLNHTVLANDDNGDRDAAIILGSLFLLLIAFPFIPIVNQLPDKLRVYKLIWRKEKPHK